MFGAKKNWTTTEVQRAVFSWASGYKLFQHEMPSFDSWYYDNDEVVVRLVYSRHGYTETWKVWLDRNTGRVTDWETDEGGF